jgi:hypothetical protein
VICLQPAGIVATNVAAAARFAVSAPHTLLLL